MKYEKAPLPVDKQTELLVARGMEVPDAASAQAFLSHTNYYRLRAYWLPFEDAAPSEGQHKFRGGTSFPQIVSLYEFDRRLRMLLLDAIERIEVSLRTRLAHVLTLKYGAHAQLLPKLFHDRQAFDDLAAEIAEELARSKETFIAHYKKKYDEPAQPPLWALVEIMSLGQLSKMYGNLELYADRRAIANVFNLNEVVIGSALHHLTHVRNICAHHCRLWNRAFVLKCRIPQSPQFVNEWFNDSEPGVGKIYNTFVLIAYLLRAINPGGDWLDRLKKLLPECPLPFAENMGFPQDWANRGIWK